MRYRAYYEEETLMLRKNRWLLAVTLLGILGVVLLISTGCDIPTSSAQTMSDDETAPRSIQVRGIGEVSAQPDVATVRLGVQTEAENAEDALSQNNESMQSLITALENADIPTDDIQTQSVQLRPRYEEPGPNGGTREVSGYVASNIVEVRVEELDALGSILDTAVQAGGNRIEGIQFEVSNTAELQDQAREAAWEDALHKAEQLASLAGAELSAPLHVTVSSDRPRPVVREEVAMERAAAAVPVRPGTQTLEVQVSVEWEIQ
jgi:hypothetical protein